MRAPANAGDALRETERRCAMRAAATPALREPARRPAQCRRQMGRTRHVTTKCRGLGAATEPACWVESSLAEWIVEQGGVVDGVELAYERHADGSVGRTLRAIRVRGGARACVGCAWH